MGSPVQRAWRARYACAAMIEIARKLPGKARRWTLEESGASELPRFAGGFRTAAEPDGAQDREQSEKQNRQQQHGSRREHVRGVRQQSEQADQQPDRREEPPVRDCP